MAQESQSGMRDGTQSRDVGIVIIKPLTKGRVEKSVHH
jgi:predicted aldo/keto reductase-like oxidoreductase